jgi:hypothetical protein
MVKEGELIGTFTLLRQEVRPFSEKQVELVSNFAKQAVIAIENTRLLNELRESLQEQTATSEVLRVISSSPGDLQPVFEAMLANATRICEAKFGNLYLYEGGALRVVASHNVPPAFAQARKRGPFHPHPSSPLSEVISPGRRRCSDTRLCRTPSGGRRRRRARWRSDHSQCSDAQGQ